MTEFKKPLVTKIFTADPSAHVFNDKLYIYVSHDLENEGLDDGKGDHFQMTDYHVLSMDDKNEFCIDHGEALHIKDVPWAASRMWASDAAYKNGKYYFYFPAMDKKGIFRIGVAVGDKPEGPFKPEPDFIPGSRSIDPAVFTDDDGKSYMYFGGRWGGQLERWETGKYEHNAPHQEKTDGDIPACLPLVAEMSDDMLSFKNLPQKVQILNENRKPFTAACEDKNYFEGPWMHKFNGKYYLSYSTGPTQFLVYAEGDNPTGPFTYKGKILEPVLGWTTHHSIVEYKGKWYLFYHDSSISGGKTHLRCAKYRELDISPDGTIKTMAYDD